MLNYLRCSYLNIIVKINPYTWLLKPYYSKGRSDEWPDLGKRYSFSWLCLSIVLSIDDGSW